MKSQPLQTTKSVDPLAKAELKEPPPIPASPFRTPKTRQEFIKEHSSTPFTTPADGNESDVMGSGNGGRKRKGLKVLGETWLRGLTNSPVISKIMTMKTPNQYIHAQGGWAPSGSASVRVEEHRT